MQWVRDYKPDPLRNGRYRQALVITLGGNILLAAGKAAAAYFSGSVAVFADAANSASDVLYSLLMVLGLWMAQRPPDLSHPQGHARFEPLVGLVVAASMAYAGFEAARQSILRLISGGAAIPIGLPLIVLLSSAGIKFGMFLAIRRLAEQVGSPALRISARDNLSDVLTSTAALIGVVGSNYLSPLLDPVAGILVALWIFRLVLSAGRENLGYLTGAGASAELRERIAALASSVPGVSEVHHTMAEYVGPRLVIDMHINVDGTLPLEQAHEIAEQVAARVSELPDVDRVYVHVEPNGVY